MSFSSKWFTAFTIWKGNWSKIQNANWGPILRIETWERNQTFPAESWSHRVWGGGSQGCDLLTFWSTRFCSAALQVNKKHSSVKARYLNLDSSVHSSCCHFSTPQLLCSCCPVWLSYVVLFPCQKWSLLVEALQRRLLPVRLLQELIGLGSHWFLPVLSQWHYFQFQRKIRLVTFLSVALSFLINPLTTIPQNEFCKRSYKTLCCVEGW